MFNEKLSARKAFQNGFFLLKTDTSPGYQNLHVNTKKDLYHNFRLYLMNTFSLFLTTVMILDKMKIAKVSQVHKKNIFPQITN